jgi:hypothetical protein
MILPVPIYRFFDKKTYADNLADKGLMRLTPTAAFPKLIDSKYKDEQEGFYEIKTFEPWDNKSDNGDYLVAGHGSSKYRKIDDAWAFCASTSNVSTARKDFTVCIHNFGRLTTELTKAVKKKFNEDLPIMFGPISYYDRNLGAFSHIPRPPYFSKPENFKNDLEFRIVIIPSKQIYELGNLEPIEIEIENPKEIFTKTYILRRE